MEPETLLLKFLQEIEKFYSQKQPKSKRLLLKWMRKTYQYKLSESATFEEGKSYIFTLTINKENPGDVGAVAPDMPWS